MTERFTVLSRSFERHNRLYRIGEVHDFSEWPAETRSADLAEVVHDGLIAPIVVEVTEESVSPGKADPALSIPSGTTRSPKR